MEFLPSVTCVAHIIQEAQLYGMCYILVSFFHYPQITIFVEPEAVMSCRILKYCIILDVIWTSLRYLFTVSLNTYNFVCLLVNDNKRRPWHVYSHDSPLSVISYIGYFKIQT